MSDSPEGGKEAERMSVWIAKDLVLMAKRLTTVTGGHIYEVIERHLRPGLAAEHDAVFGPLPAGGGG